MGPALFLDSVRHDVEVERAAISRGEVGGELRGVIANGVMRDGRSSTYDGPHAGNR